MDPQSGTDSPFLMTVASVICSPGKDVNRHSWKSLGASFGLSKVEIWCKQQRKNLLQRLHCCRAYKNVPWLKMFVAGRLCSGKNFFQCKSKFSAHEGMHDITGPLHHFSQNSRQIWLLEGWCDWIHKYTVAIKSIAHENWKLRKTFQGITSFTKFNYMQISVLLRMQLQNKAEASRKNFRDVSMATKIVTKDEHGRKPS